ncbi:MAG TPA: transporter [Rhizobacter sp.]|nr:transporter [Rhizobacter sp.]
MNRSPSTLKALALCAGLACAPAAFAGEVIATDRPDFVESSDVVDPGRFQIETSLSAERNSGDGVKTRTYSTPTLLRFGLREGLELRVESDGFIRATTEANGSSLTERGFADASVGVKWHMQDGDDATGKPAIGWLLHFDLDSGSAAFRGQGVRPSLRAVFEWDLPNSFSIGVMPGFVVDKNEAGERFTAGILAAVLGKDITPEWHAFVELAGRQITSVKNGGSVLSFDAGASYLVSNSVQVDFSFARGLNAYSPDWQYGVGLSVRF